MWAMSDRAIPRSYRMMEGFGVHTFRFVNEEGKARFVKFHWKPVLGVHSLVWDEGFPQIAAVIVGIFPGDCLRFVPDERMDAKDGLPVKFNKARLAFFIYKPERMNAEAFHHPDDGRLRRSYVQVCK